MTARVDASDVSTADTAHSYFAFASDLRLPPGHWPEQLLTDLGNGQPLVLRGRADEGGAFYVQSLGCVCVRVFND